VQDALCLEDLGRTFDTIIDSGLFHALTDPERPCFARSLSAALRPGGTSFMLTLSELEPGEYGPRRVTQPEIRAAFEDGWRVDWIRAGVFEGLKQPAGYRAWLSSITRVGYRREAGCTPPDPVPCVGARGPLEPRQRERRVHVLR
jgi:cyclopropane fatty-acyl-phospholipid synthase-like methyltransferase